MAAVVVLPVADDLHGIVAAEQAQPRLLVDVQVLTGGGVVIVHIEGDLKLHAAHGIHQFSDGLPLHDDVEVRGDARQAAHLFFQGGHTVFHLGALVLALVIVVHRIQALAGGAHVDHGVPGQTQAVHLFVHRVIGEQDHSIGIAAAGGVLTHQEEGIHPVLPSALGHAGHLSADITGQDIPALGIYIGQLGHPDPALQDQESRNDNQGDDHRPLQQAITDALCPGKPGHPPAVLGPKARLLMGLCHPPP